MKKIKDQISLEIVKKSRESQESLFINLIKVSLSQLNLSNLNLKFQKELFDLAKVLANYSNYIRLEEIKINLENYLEILKSKQNTIFDSAPKYLPKQKAAFDVDIIFEKLFPNAQHWQLLIDRRQPPNENLTKNMNDNKQENTKIPGQTVQQTTLSLPTNQSSTAKIVVDEAVPLNSLSRLNNSTPSLPAQNTHFATNIAKPSEQVSLEDVLVGIDNCITILENIAQKNSNKFDLLIYFSYKIFLIHTANYLSNKLTTEVQTLFSNKLKQHIAKKGEYLKIFETIAFSEHHRSLLTLIRLDNDTFQTYFPEIKTIILNYFSNFLSNQKKQKDSLSSEKELKAIIDFTVFWISCKDPKRMFDLINDLQIAPPYTFPLAETLMRYYNYCLSHYLTLNECLKKELNINTTIAKSLELIHSLKHIEIDNQFDFTTILSLYYNIQDINPKLDLNFLKPLLNDLHNSKKNNWESVLLYFLDILFENLSKNKIPHLEKVNLLLKLMQGLSVKQPKRFLQKIFQLISLNFPSSEITNSAFEEFEFSLINFAKHIILQCKKNKNLVEEKLLSTVESKIQTFYRLKIEQYEKDRKIVIGNFVAYDTPHFISHQMQEIICCKDDESRTFAMSMLNDYLSIKPEFSQVLYLNLSKQIRCYSNESVNAKYFAEILLEALDNNNYSKLFPLMHYNPDIFSEIIIDKVLLEKYLHFTKKIVQHQGPLLINASIYKVFDNLTYQLLCVIKDGNYTQTHIDMLAFIFENSIHTYATQKPLPPTNPSQQIRQLLDLKDEINAYIISKGFILELHLYSDFTALDVKDWSFSHVILQGSKFDLFKGYRGQNTAKIAGTTICGDIELHELLKFSDIDATVIDDKEKYRFNFSFTLEKDKKPSNSYSDIYSTAPICAMILFSKGQRLLKQLEEKDKLIEELKKTNKVSSKRKSDNFSSPENKRVKKEIAFSVFSGLLFTSESRHQDAPILSEEEITNIITQKK